MTTIASVSSETRYCPQPQQIVIPVPETAVVRQSVIPVVIRCERVCKNTVLLLHLFDCVKCIPFYSAPLSSNSLIFLSGLLFSVMLISFTSRMFLCDIFSPANGPPLLLWALLFLCRLHLHSLFSISFFLPASPLIFIFSFQIFYFSKS